MPNARINSSLEERSINLEFKNRTISSSSERKLNPCPEVVTSSEPSNYTISAAILPSIPRYRKAPSSDQVSALMKEIKRHRRVSADSSLTAEACLSHDSEHPSGLLRDGTRSLVGWFCNWINYVKAFE
ncbi:hypothetical protein CDAR_504541 [Caerostris darwini]|uniref:Uncharacterized protein n=1 Tax=Caerostris darwini TaxID=1538125 RepID=A0AAV4S8D3_9ARAC|nr:hypothetical protein CDAR_504541 [Caerostris darwini]